MLEINTTETLSHCQQLYHNKQDQTHHQNSAAATKSHATDTAQEYSNTVSAIAIVDTKIKTSLDSFLAMNKTATSSCGQ